MNDFIVNLQNQPWIIIAAAAIIGYFVGSISTARMVYFLSTGSTDYSPFAEPVPHSDEVFESDLISATWVTKKLGKKYGCLTSILDMLKVALPTLLFKLLFALQPYFLLVAITGIAGHNYPVYHRFKGGRGESPIIGALLVINWFGYFVANAAASVLGYLTGSILVLRWGAYILLILWFWIYFQDIYYIIFMVLANFLFWFSMRHDLRRFRELKKIKGLKFSEEDVSDFILMGKSMGRFMDKYGLYHVIKRLFKKNTSPKE
ncbi:MAG: glycerol-3-phosphate acyltransferase [Bacteroidales bacterium]|nr:glycerol-3-phosphate acyltransferase [Bacteroidales bacterium]